MPRPAPSSDQQRHVSALSSRSRIMSKRATPRFLFPLLRATIDIGQDVEGGTAIEYGLIAAFIVLALLGVMPNVMDALINLPLSSLLSALANALS
jgi:Flp pilus assembly pilin Flp